MPILTVEAMLAALTSFTLVGPLGLPWWLLLAGLALAGLVLVGLGRLASRNWLVLRGLGVDASLLDAVAVLIAIVTIGQLPVGPSNGAAAVVHDPRRLRRGGGRRGRRAADRHRHGRIALLRGLGGGGPPVARPR